MSKPCEDQWRRRAGSSPFCAAVMLGDDALVLGRGTVLRSLGSESCDAIALKIDAQHDRMVALLAVAAHGRLSKHALVQLEAALGEWRRGDRGLAAIRLAFARLPRLQNDDDAYRLFLAETALDAGLAANDLLRHLGYTGCAPLLKFNPYQPRVPSGSGTTSGQWTSGDADAAPSLIPVFLDTQPDGEDEVIQDKERRRGFGETSQERTEEGQIIRPPLPGERIGPAVPSGPDGAGVVDPGSGAKPGPLPKPGGDDPSPPDNDDKDKGPACPEQEDDILRGENHDADLFEYNEHPCQPG